MRLRSLRRSDFKRRLLGRTRVARVALLVLWLLIALLVLADLGEAARGDSYLVRSIPWDLLAGASLSLAILVIDEVLHALRR
jgi:hypothetical protein